MQGPPPPWEHPGSPGRDRWQQRHPRREAPGEWHPGGGRDAPHGWQDQPGWDQGRGAHPDPQGYPGWDQTGWDQAGWDHAGWDHAGWDHHGWDGHRDPGHAGWGGGDEPPGRSRVYGGGTPAGPDRPGGTSGGRGGRAPRWALITVVLGAFLLVVSGGGAVAGAMLMDRYTGNVRQENLLGQAAVDPGEALDGPINMLLLGTDGRQDGTDDARSDTIIVLHVPSTHDQAYLISVPRDTWVTVPGYWDMKITEAFYHGNQDGGWQGGAQLVAAAINNLTGLRFNAAAIVNFSGFETIIDELGGIEFCVEVAATSEHLVTANGQVMGIGDAKRQGLPYERIRYEPGCQQLEGWQALDYVRQRKNLETDEGDYARQRHQQQLLRTIASQATSKDVMTNLGLVDRLLQATGDALIMDTNQVPLEDFAFTMRNIRPGDLMSLKTNDGWYNSAQVEGVSAEMLSEESVAMFEAAANDTMAEFVLDHPDVVNEF